MSDKTKFELRIVAYREEGAWLAHCLEFDIVADGKTSKKAVRDLIDLCILQIKVAIEENGLPSIIRPAPAEIWTMFLRATRKVRLSSS
jgi:predicted RNase H-like HicB family nuclease